MQTVSEDHRAETGIVLTGQVAAPSLWGSFTPRPWQERAVLAAVGRISQSSCEPFVIGGPTGSGKSLEMIALMRHVVNGGGRAALYTNRRLLTNQMMGVLGAAGLKYGVRAADFEGHEDSSAPIQICSTQTEQSRVLNRRKRAIDEGMSVAQAEQKWPLEHVDLVLFDECHLQKSESVAALMGEHQERGAKVIGFTATPSGLSHLFSELVQAGTVSECIRHKALVPAHVYSCEELDTSKIKPQATGEYSLGEIVKKIWTPRIFGYVWEQWKRLNPDGRQTLGFSPGVDESVWFAEQFESPQKWEQQQAWLEAQRVFASEFSIANCEEFWKQGVRAAHIDGMEVWLDNKRYKTTPQARADILGEWKDGKIKVVWNRFVLREGIDQPSLYHLILACPIGSALSYVQVVGRAMRYSAETPDAVLITDHGGCAWRHGSPNEDRDWQRYWNLPVSAMTEDRMDGMRDGKVKEPITCPRCRAMRRSGSVCWKCGYEHTKSSKLVLQVGGQLKEFSGSSVKPLNVQKRADTQKKWDDMYFQAFNAHRKLQDRVEKLRTECESNPHLKPVLESSQNILDKKIAKAQTFRQLRARFFLEHHYYPPDTLANMPHDSTGWYRKVRDVKRDEVRRHAEQ